MYTIPRYATSAEARALEEADFADATARAAATARASPPKRPVSPDPCRGKYRPVARPAHGPLAQGTAPWVGTLCGHSSAQPPARNRGQLPAAIEASEESQTEGLYAAAAGSGNTR